MHSIESKYDRTGDGLYNFKKEFLATDEELTVISALLSIVDEFDN